jgi:hypothetical protein
MIRLNLTCNDAANGRDARMYDAVLSETVTITGHGGDAIEAYPARPLTPGPVGGVLAA